MSTDKMSTGKLSTKKNERFEKQLIHLILNPHQDILTQLASITNNISLQLFIYYFLLQNVKTFINESV